MLNYQFSPLFTPKSTAEQSLSVHDRIEGFSQLVSSMIQSLSTVDLPEGVEREDLEKALESFRDRKIQQIQEQLPLNR